MKTILRLFPLLWLCLSAGAQTHVQFTISDFLGQVVTNRKVTVQAMSIPNSSSGSVILGDLKTYYTDVNGQFTLSNIMTSLYQCDITYPPSSTKFKIAVLTNNLGLIQASTIMVADSTSTFPAGSVAWAAAISDLRYAKAGTTGIAAAAGTNIVLGTNIAGTLVTVNFANIATNTSLYGPHLYTNVWLHGGAQILQDSPYNFTINNVNGSGTNWINSSASLSSILGGGLNIIGPSGIANAIVGGSQNFIIAGSGGNYDFIGGGSGNSIGSGGIFSVIPGGYFNTNNGSYSFAGGYQAVVTNDSVFAWGDSSGGITSKTNKTFIVSVQNGVGINTNYPGTNALKVVGNVDSTIGFTVNGTPLSSGDFTKAGTNIVNSTNGSVVTVNLTTFPVLLGIQDKSGQFGLYDTNGNLAFSFEGNGSPVNIYGTLLVTTNLVSGVTGQHIGNGAGLTNLNGLNITNSADIISSNFAVMPFSNGSIIPQSGASNAPSGKFKGQLLVTTDVLNNPYQLWQWNGSAWISGLQLADYLIADSTNVNHQLSTLLYNQNVLSIQNRTNSGYSAIRFLNYLGQEQMALGIGQTNTPIYAGGNFLEWDGVPFSFTASSQLYWGISGTPTKWGTMATAGDFVGYQSGTTNADDTNVLVRISRSSGNILTQGTIKASNNIATEGTIRFGTGGVGGAGQVLNLGAGNAFINVTAFDLNNTASFRNLKLTVPTVTYEAGPVQIEMISGNGSGIAADPDSKGIRMGLAGTSMLGIRGASSGTNVSSLWSVVPFNLRATTNWISGDLKVSGTIYGGTDSVSGHTNSSLTASTLILADANKAESSSSVTATEAGYLSGVTSALQTQIDSKPTTSSGVAFTNVSQAFSGAQIITNNSSVISANKMTNTSLSATAVVTTDAQKGFSSIAFDGNTAHFLNGNGAFTTPAGGSSATFNVNQFGAGTGTDGTNIVSGAPFTNTTVWPSATTTTPLTINTPANPTGKLASFQTNGLEIAFFGTNAGLNIGGTVDPGPGAIRVSNNIVAATTGIGFVGDASMLTNYVTQISGFFNSVSVSTTLRFQPLCGGQASQTVEASIATPPLPYSCLYSNFQVRWLSVPSGTNFGAALFANGSVTALTNQSGPGTGISVLATDTTHTVAVPAGQTRSIRFAGDNSGATSVSAIWTLDVYKGP